MGNSQTSELRHAISIDDAEKLQKLLAHSQSKHYINKPLNRDWDTPLILAARLNRLEMVKILVQAGCDINRENRRHDTALDVVLNSKLPPDGDILHNHFCPYSHTADNVFQTDELVQFLISAHARGKSLERLVLHNMRNAASISNIIESLSNIHHANMFRTSGLLLQITVWFEQTDNLLKLFSRGVPLENFWSAAFMPKIQPPPHLRSVPWPRGEEGDYTVAPQPESNVIQSLKFSFIQDWRVDWNDGENPEAQFRAGLQLTPTAAAYFIRAANSYDILVRVMSDILQYLPTACNGPELNQTNLLELLTLAGYIFSEEEILHLSLKFHLDFAPYRKFQAQPKKLKELCRMVMRNSFRQNVYCSVERMPNLPAVISGYLVLNDC